jgi:hypothetical protein
MAKPDNPFHSPSYVIGGAMLQIRMAAFQESAGSGVDGRAR